MVNGFLVSYVSARGVHILMCFISAMKRMAEELASAMIIKKNMFFQICLTISVQSVLNYLFPKKQYSYMHSAVAGSHLPHALHISHGKYRFFVSGIAVLAALLAPHIAASADGPQAYCFVFTGRDEAVLRIHGADRANTGCVTCICLC